MFGNFCFKLLTDRNGPLVNFDIPDTLAGIGVANVAPLSRRGAPSIQILYQLIEKLSEKLTWHYFISPGWTPN